MKKITWLGRRGAIIGGVAAGVLLIGGITATAAFAGDGADDDPSGTTTQVDHDGDDHDGDDDRNEADEAVPPLDTKVDIAEAADKATDEVSGGSVTSVELSGTTKKPVWEVDVITDKGVRHDVVVDATSGKVTANTVDKDDDGTDD